MSVSILFASVGLIILLGFVGSYFFKKTMIPDIIWLLVLGVIIGPIFNLVDRAFFIEYSPFLTSLAIMIILFQGGIHTNIYSLIKQSSRSLLLAVLGIIFSMIVCSAFTYYFLGWEIMNGLLLGAMLGGSSSPIIISLTKRLPLDDDLKTLMNIESTLTDAFCIIAALVVVDIMVMGSYSSLDIAKGIVGTFSIGAVMGFIVGMIWIGGLSRIRGKEFEYMLIISILLLLYSFVESINGSGAIASFVFGVVLANSKEIGGMLKIKKSKLRSEIGHFHNEVSFLVKTFFFLYLGIILTLNSYYVVLIGVMLTFLLLIARILTVQISTYGSKILPEERYIMSTFIPRGLAAAVLTQLPIIYGLSNPDIYTDIVVNVIFISIVVTSISVILLKKKMSEINHSGKRRRKKRKR